MEKKSERRKSLLFVLDHSVDSISGAVESVKVVIDKAKEKYNILLVTPGLASLEDEAVQHNRYSRYTSMKELIWHPIEFTKYYLHLLQLIKSSEIHIIHTQEQIGCFIVSFFKRLHLIDKNILLLHTERGLYEKYNSIIQNIFFFSLPYIHTFILTTQYNRDLWEDAVARKKLVQTPIFQLIENTAGMHFETYDPEKRKSDDGFLTVGFAGRYCSWKGWGLAEELCQRFSENPRIKVHIVMGCNNKSDRLATDALFQRLRMNLGNRFTGDINFGIAQMSDFYYGLDIFIITSDPGTESFGRVLVEAMCRKVVVLGTDCGGATEVIGDCKNICADADAFVKRVRELFADKEQLHAEQERCYRRVKECYSLESNIEAHMEMYAQCLNE